MTSFIATMGLWICSSSTLPLAKDSPLFKGFSQRFKKKNFLLYLHLEQVFWQPMQKSEKIP